MPIVGTKTASVIRFVVSAATISKTILNTPASCSALASANKTLASDSVFP
uniref:Uncharacterized protein n=1 Tax=uncultured marine crenarchaeote HF4000_APKG8G15 TaxID=455605 RepID=B3TAW4_9ARCH|nr:hypothetical protein ALOHA_HF4000APKG8G15ctg1g62 [uncultured marine crenarchaeote HF4000_APKG8G15]